VDVRSRPGPETGRMQYRWPGSGARKGVKIGRIEADMGTQRMNFPLSLTLLLLMFLVGTGYGQQTGQSTLRLEVRAECGLLSTTTELGPDAGEGVVRFLYAARTGPAGGRIEVRLPPGSGAADLTTTAGGPAEARPPFVLAAGEAASVAVLPPQRGTTREGAAGEVRWRWHPGAQITDERPVLSVACR
jgi:hypothetical protein